MTRPMTMARPGPDGPDKPQTSAEVARLKRIAKIRQVHEKRLRAAKRKMAERDHG